MGEGEITEGKVIVKVIRETKKLSISYYTARVCRNGCTTSEHCALGTTSFYLLLKFHFLESSKS